MSDYRITSIRSGNVTQNGVADGVEVGTRIVSSSGTALGISGGGNGITIAAGEAVTVAAGTGTFDFSNSSGIFTTSSGTNTLSGNVTISGSKTFTTGTGTVTINGATTFTAAGTALTVNNNATVTGNLTVSGNQTIAGNLTVSGTTTTTHSESVLIDDNHLYLNNAYTSDAAQTGGLVVNYDPTTTTTTVSGAYVAGVVAGANPTVTTTGAATFALADVIQFSGSTNNNGLFEVLSHAANVLTIRGIGSTATVEDFTQNQFVAGASDGASIYKVAVSVLRAFTDGVWETAKGATTPFTFTPLATAATTTLQSAYENGNTITTSAPEGNVIVTGTEDFVIFGTVDFSMTSTGAITATALTGAVSITTTSTMSMRGGGVSVFGDDTGFWSFSGIGALSTSGVTTLTHAGSGAISITGTTAAFGGSGAVSITSTGAGASVTGATTASLTAVTGAASMSGGTTVTLTGTTGTTVGTTGGTLSLTGPTVSMSASTATLTADCATSLSIGPSSATSIAIGHSGITTTITGGLTQLTGAFSLTGSGATSSVTTSGVALTITAGAASTWKSSVGLLTIEGAAGIQLNGAAATSYLTIGVTSNQLIIQGSRTLTTTGTGNINLPNDGTTNFQIAGTSVGNNVIAVNLTTLTASSTSNADSLHAHSKVVVNGLTTTGVTTGLFGYLSGNSTLTLTDAVAGSIAKARVFGANEGTSGSMTVAGTITSAAFTTAGGATTAGNPCYLAKSTDEASAAGKLTATAPTTGFLAEVGLILVGAVAGSSTSILLQPKTVVTL